ncbi:MAG: AAA family ATPase [Bdellovibrionales bacterium]|nr:AAA family ATPase [Bdellovibrionales bacterium]
MSATPTRNYTGPERRRQNADVFDLKEILRFVLRHYKMYFVLGLVSSAMVLAHHYGFPSYRARSIIYVSQGSSQIDQITNRLQGVQFAEDTHATDVDKYLRYLNSEDFFRVVAERIEKSGALPLAEEEIRGPDTPWNLLRGLLSKKPVITSHERVVSALNRWISFEKIGADGVVIHATTSRSALSKRVADVVSELAVDWISRNEILAVEKAVAYIRERIEESESNIKTLEEQMYEFKKERRLVTLDSAEIARKTSELEAQLEAAKLEYSQNERMLRRYRAQMAGQRREIEEMNREAVANGVSPIKFKTNISERAAEKEAANQALEARIASIQHQIEQALGASSFRVEQSAFDFRKRLEMEYSLFEELKREMFRAEIQKVSMGAKVNNLQKSDSAAVYRRIGITKKGIITMILVVVFGTMLSYLSEILWPVIKSKADLERAGFSFLGALPDLSSFLAKRSPNMFAMVDGKVKNIFRFDTDSGPLNHFFKLRTKIIYKLDAAGITHGFVTVTSGGPGDGKTFLSVNLAAAFARMGKKVLLIDGDFRMAEASDVFNSHGKAGFAEVIDAPETFGRIVRKDVLQNIDFLPAGRKVSNPVEHLTSASCRSLCERLKELYDMVIFDTAPLIVAPLGTEIERISDLVIFVAQFNKTPAEAVARGAEHLLDFYHGNKKFVGVLNRTDARYESLVMLAYSDYHDHMRHNRSQKDQSV